MSSAREEREDQESRDCWLQARDWSAGFVLVRSELRERI